jgi:hypothetical protein
LNNRNLFFADKKKQRPQGLCFLIVIFFAPGPDPKGSGCETRIRIFLRGSYGIASGSCLGTEEKTLMIKLNKNV